MEFSGRRVAGREAYFTRSKASVRKSEWPFRLRAIRGPSMMLSMENLRRIAAAAFAAALAIFAPLAATGATTVSLDHGTVSYTVDGAAGSWPLVRQPF
jgi:hypothetical protein